MISYDDFQELYYKDTWKNIPESKEYIVSYKNGADYFDYNGHRIWIHGIQGLYRFLSFNIWKN